MKGHLDVCSGREYHPAADAMVLKISRLVAAQPGLVTGLLRAGQVQPFPGQAGMALWDTWGHSFAGGPGRPINPASLSLEGVRRQFHFAPSIVAVEARPVDSYAADVEPAERVEQLGPVGR